MNQIYGITGRKFSGKDTFANYVVEENKDFKIFRFADDLKDMSSEIFNFERYSADDPNKKEEIFPSMLNMDDYIGEMSKVTGLKIKPQKKVACSIREILQFFGTEYVRSVDDLYWVNRVKEKALKHDKVLITDMRFLNEKEMIESLDGLTIKIKRIDLKDSGDLHKSEQEMDMINPSLLLGTMTNKFSLQREVAGYIARGEIDEIFKFDYRPYMILNSHYSK